MPLGFDGSLEDTGLSQLKLSVPGRDSSAVAGCAALTGRKEGSASSSGGNSSTLSGGSSSSSGGSAPLKSASASLSVSGYMTPQSECADDPDDHEAVMSPEMNLYLGVESPSVRRAKLARTTGVSENSTEHTNRGGHSTTSQSSSSSSTSTMKMSHRPPPSSSSSNSKSLPSSTAVAATTAGSVGSSSVLSAAASAYHSRPSSSSVRSVRMIAGSSTAKSSSSSMTRARSSHLGSSSANVNGLCSSTSNPSGSITSLSSGNGMTNHPSYTANPNYYANHSRFAEMMSAGSLDTTALGSGGAAGAGAPAFSSTTTTAVPSYYAPSSSSSSHCQAWSTAAGTGGGSVFDTSTMTTPSVAGAMPTQVPSLDFSAAAAAAFPAGFPDLSGLPPSFGAVAASASAAAAAASAATGAANNHPNNSHNNGTMNGSNGTAGCIGSNPEYLNPQSFFPLMNYVIQHCYGTAAPMMGHPQGGFPSSMAAGAAAGTAGGSAGAANGGALSMVAGGGGGCHPYTAGPPFHHTHHHTHPHHGHPPHSHHHSHPHQHHPHHHLAHAGQHPSHAHHSHGHALTSLSHQHTPPNLLDLCQDPIRLVRMCQDKEGSRYVQRLLEDPHAPSDHYRAVAGVLFNSRRRTLELCQNVFGNYIVQKMLEKCCEELETLRGRELSGLGISLVKCIFEGNTRELSSNHCSCRVVQRLLRNKHREYFDAKVLIWSELRCDTETLLSFIENPFGNHVLQHCVDYLPSMYMRELCDIMNGRTVTLSKHKYGCRVVQKVMAKISYEYIDFMFEECLESTAELMKHEFGNYVIQHIMDTCKDDSLLIRLVNRVCKESEWAVFHKYASPVIEKVLLSADMSLRLQLFQTIVHTKTMVDSQGQIMMMNHSNHPNNSSTQMSTSMTTTTTMMMVPPPSESADSTCSSSTATLSILPISAVEGHHHRRDSSNDDSGGAGVCAANQSARSLLASPPIIRGEGMTSSVCSSVSLLDSSTTAGANGESEERLDEDRMGNNNSNNNSRVKSMRQVWLVQKMVEHQFGNYVIQRMLDCCSEPLFEGYSKEFVRRIVDGISRQQLVKCPWGRFVAVKIEPFLDTSVHW